MTSVPIVLSSTKPLPFQNLSRICARECHSSSFSQSGVVSMLRPPRKKSWTATTRRGSQRRAGPIVEARLFGPAMFESSKLRVLVLPAEEDCYHNKHNVQEEAPRIYTLTHSDVTAQITLTVAREINSSQIGGWYSRFQRDEVVAEWRRTKGVMSLHVHCHISGGGNVLHSLIARLRFYIFRKELPVVLQAFRVGDRQLFRKNPALNYAPVWVYFHSSMAEFNRVEFWGPLVEACRRSPQLNDEEEKTGLVPLSTSVCLTDCHCCSRRTDVVPVSESLRKLLTVDEQERRP